MRFIKGVQYDIRVFVYIWLLLMIFRCIFLGIYASQISNVSVNEIMEALFLGARISLKTAGLCAGIPFLLATCINVIWSKWPGNKIHLFWGALCSSIFSLLFMIRIPYYQVFQQSFNIMIFNGMEDDMHAIFTTMLGEYQLIPRLLGSIIVIGIVIFIWYQWYRMPVWQPKQNIRLWNIGIICLLPVISVFFRFGGAFSFDFGISWESAARMNNNLLNEAILDDGQALYRAYSTYKRAHKQAVRHISSEEVQQAIQILGGNPKAKTIDDAFQHTAKGSPLPEQPRQVVLILGENYALWPLLPMYRELGLTKTGEMLEKNGAHTYHFLANGTGTMTSLNGLLTGIPDVGIYTNYILGKNGDVDQLGIGAVMKSMGYKTVFWYGGMRSWQDIGNFTLREGFDEFHCADEFTASEEKNSWGVPDEILFQSIQEYMVHDTGKTFHFILTTSNHPPFSVNIDDKGFPRDRVIHKLPPSIPRDEKTVRQLGHIWYADNIMGKFIDNVQEINPSTLFVITGDHAERFNFTTAVSLEENSLIPCFFYGAGITSEMIPSSSVGSHLSIMPTLAELLLPTGKHYEALMPPLMDSDKAFNHRLVIKNNIVSEQKTLQDSSYKQYIEAARTIAIWRINQGNLLH